jgi:hypothetical protein
MSLLATILNRIASLAAGQVILGSLFAPNKPLCFRLLWMAKNDQRERQACLNGRPWNDRIDQLHTRAMKKIVSRYGWPGEKLVGPIGVEAAWLLVQHADGDPAFQKHCHRLLEEAVRRRAAQARHLAYLTDRICVADRVPQIYAPSGNIPLPT